MMTKNKEEEHEEVNKRAEEEEVVDMAKSAADQRSSSPRPLEALASLGSGPPRFLTKTFDIVEDPSTNAAISWSRIGNSFVIWDPFAFSNQLLPKFFKHNNFSSFVRQLNTYGFRKVDPDQWEFANEAFLRGQKQLLSNIRRRKPSSAYQDSGAAAILEAERYRGRGVESELEGLRQDKNTLMMEVVQLQKWEQEMQHQVKTMSKRMQATEQQQKKILAFLARLVHNPAFLSHLTQQQLQQLNPSSSYSPCLTTIKKRRLLPTQDSNEEIRACSESSSEKSESPTGNPNPNAIAITSPDNLPFLEMDSWHSQFEELLLELNPSKGSTSLELQPVPPQATGLHSKQSDKSEEGEGGGDEEEATEVKSTTEAETMLLALTGAGGGGANGVAEEQLFWEQLLAANTSAFSMESTPPQCSTVAGYNQALAATTPLEEEEEEEETERWEQKPSVEKLAEKLGHLN